MFLPIIGKNFSVKTVKSAKNKAKRRQILTRTNAFDIVFLMVFLETVLKELISL